MTSNATVLDDASLCNTINQKGLIMANKGKKINRAVMLSNYTKEIINECWESFTINIIQNYEKGKGTYIKGFGTFTFKREFVNLEGTTNEYFRDKREAPPVFVLSREFNKCCLPGEFTQLNAIRYYKQKENKNIPIMPLNYSEIAYRLSMSKDEVENIISNLIKNISDSITEGKFKNKIFPNLGVLFIRYNIIAMKFNEDFIDKIKGKNDKFIKLRKYNRFNTEFNLNKSLTSGKISKTLNDFFDNDLKAENSLNTVLDNSCCEYLKSEFNIDINQIPEHNIKNIYKDYEENEGNIDFINDYSPSKTRNKRKNNLFDSPLFSLDEESINSFAYYKGILISNAKKYDINKYGIITKDEAISSIINSNISDKIDSILAEKIVEFYNKTDKIEYMKFIAKIIKDIQNYTFLKGNKKDININNNDLNITETKKNSLPNLINNLKRSTLNKSYSNKLYPIKKLNIQKSQAELSKDSEEKLPYIKSNKLKFNSNLRYIQEESKNEDLTNNISSEEEKDFDLINKNINIDEIKSMIRNIKPIISELRQKYLTSISQNISSFELVNILKKYNISYQKDEIDNLLNFLGIKDIKAFSLEDFIFFVKKCKVAEAKFNKNELKPILENLKDIIYINGGANFLFKNGTSDSLTCDTFIKIIKEKVNYEYDILKDLFYYMVKTDRAFTLNDYFKYIQNDKKDLNEEYYITNMKIIINEINNKHLSPDEYFSHLLSYNKSTKDKFITRLNWIKYLKKEKINLSSKDIDNLFLWIDTKKDNLIDRDEFLSKYNFTTKPLTVFKDIIYNNKLDKEDLAHRMNMNINEIKQLNYEEFRDKIKKIDSTLKESFIMNIFEELKNNSINNTNLLDQKKFLKEINYKKDDCNENNKNKYFTEIYREAILKKIKYEELKKLFEKRDESNLGLLTKTDYTSVISKVIPGFNDDDHLIYIRITDSLDKDTNKIIYSKILNSIFFYIPEKQNDEFIVLCQILSKILVNECDNDLEKLYYYISKGKIKKPSYINKIKPLTLEQISKFLKEKYNKNISEKAILKFDVDADGEISYEDMKSILKRYNLTNFFKFNNKVSNPQINFFSQENLPDVKIKSIIKNLYNYMKMKNITEIGLFKKLDKNGDGFISNVELNEGLDDIIKLNSNIKDQFFNFLDYYHLGMVDLSTFISRLTNSENNQRFNYLCQNNNKIENLILEEFQKYCRKYKEYSDTEIYKVIDKDCDGIINYSDFKNFVINILKIPKDDIYKENLERVMMTLSLSKNIQIGINDIREFINISNGQNDMNLKQVFKITSNQNLSELKQNKEWTNDIIERFGMFISEKYDTIQQFFDQYTTPGSDKFKFEDFLKFKKDNMDLFGNGFNVTKDELLSIFTSLDSQKKNYLTKQDLENKLQIFNFYNKMHIDIKNFLQQNFENGVDAFKFFMKQKNEKSKKVLVCEENKNNNMNKNYSISLKEFFETFENFFPKKYATNTILKYLNKYFKISIPNSPDYLTQRKDTINFDEFNYLYFDKLENNKKFIYNKNKQTKLFTSRYSFSKEMRKTFLKRSSSMLNSLHLKSCNINELKKPSKYNLNSLKTPFDFEPLNKLKRIIFSSKLNLLKYFELMSHKTDNQNYLNKHVFRTMIKNFKIGLTNQEIDYIISKCGSNSYDGKINLKDFIQFLKGQSNILNEGNKNIEEFIGEIKSLIYKYYSNPIICFQNNDLDRTGKIDFDKFKNILSEMYSKENQKLPNFAMMKNAYDTLDLRKDGIIDIKEWCIAFASYNSKLDHDADKVPNGPEFFNNKKNKGVNTEDICFGHNRIEMREWETSDEVVDIYLFIHKNRKLIKNKIYESNFTVINEKENFIHSENLISVLKDLLPNHKLNKLQWKMIVNIAQNENNNNLIDIEKFFRIIEITAKNLTTQPKIINYENIRIRNKNKLRRTISESSLLSKDKFENNGFGRMKKYNCTNIYQPKINMVNMVNFKNVVLPGEIKKSKIKTKKYYSKTNGI